MDEIGGELSAKLIPARGLKHDGWFPSQVSKVAFREANPRKGTETKDLINIRKTLCAFREANPRKGTETK